MSDSLRKFAGVICLLLGATLGTISISVQMHIELTVNRDGEPPVAVDQLGWAGPDAVREAEPLVAGMPPFQIVGDDPNRDYQSSRVVLWDYAKLANAGKHLPNKPQQIGDCVSWGWANAIRYLQAVRVARDMRREKWREVYPPFIYGTSRVLVGQGRLGCRSDGSVGAWAARAVVEYGVLWADEPGVPEYSGATAKKWGCDGPPQAMRDLAADYLVRTVAPVREIDDVTRAICNGFPVPVASMYGTKTFRQVDNKWVANNDGRWAHQMCLIGYDGTGSEPLWYCLNSWGEHAHKQPLDGEPPGGFWVDSRGLRTMLAARDSFVVSDLSGFPAADTDFFLASQEVGTTAAATSQEGSTMGMPVVGMVTALLLCAIGFGLIFGRWRARGVLAPVVTGAAVLLTGGIASAGTDFEIATMTTAAVADQHVDFAFELEPPPVFDLGPKFVAVAAEQEEDIRPVAYAWSEPGCAPCQLLKQVEDRLPCRLEWNPSNVVRLKPDVVPVIQWRTDAGWHVVVGWTSDVAQLEDRLRKFWREFEANQGRVASRR